MRVIYTCFGGAHSSVVAANLHLGRLPTDRTATRAEILAQPRFDNDDPGRMGTPHLMGTDDQGNEVWVLGLAAGRPVLEPALRQFLAYHGIGPDQVLIVSALEPAGLLLKMGGILSRGLGLIWPGRPLAALGVQLRYRSFCQLVRAVQGAVGPDRSSELS